VCSGINSRSIRLPYLVGRTPDVASSLSLAYTQGCGEVLRRINICIINISAASTAMSDSEDENMLKPSHDDNMVIAVNGGEKFFDHLGARVELGEDQMIAIASDGKTRAVLQQGIAVGYIETMTDYKNPLLWGQILERYSEGNVEPESVITEADKDDCQIIVNPYPRFPIKLKVENGNAPKFHSKILKYACNHLHRLECELEEFKISCHKEAADPKYSRSKTSRSTKNSGFMTVCAKGEAFLTEYRIFDDIGAWKKRVESAVNGAMVIIQYRPEEVTTRTYRKEEKQKDREEESKTGKKRKKTKADKMHNYFCRNVKDEPHDPAVCIGAATVRNWIKD
jgi:hypothetical protein